MRILFAVMFVVMMSFGVVVPILPFLAKEMRASPVEMSLLMTGWAFMQMVASPVWGHLADRYGRKRIMLVGLIGNGLTFVLMGTAQRYEVLLVARTLGGALAAATFPTAQALAADLSPPDQRAQAMGLIGSSFGAGFLLGPTVGGLLAAVHPRLPFWASALASLLILAVAQLSIKDSPGRQPGTVQGLRSGGLRAALTGGEAAPYWLAFVGTFTASSLFSMMGYFFIDRLQSNELNVGIAFTALGLGSLIAPLGLLGWLSRIGGDARTLEIGFVLSAAGFLVLSFSGTFALALAATTVTGAGFAVLRPALGTMVSQRTRMGYGSAMGLLSGFDALGRSVGPLWAGFSYSLGPALTFVSAGGICGLCAVFVRHWAQADVVRAQP